MALLAAAFLPMPAARASAATASARIAFAVDTRDTGTCCRLNIATMRPDGSGVRILTHVGLGVFAVRPAWSPDGRAIAFELRVNQPVAGVQIWRVAADGTGLHRLVADPFFADFFPTYSPDGRRLAFSRCRPDFSACALYGADADGTHLRALLPFRSEVLNFKPSYSPDGRWIAIESRNRGGFLSAVYVLHSDGSGLHRVTPARLQAFGPSWAPDGRGLLFTTNCCVTPRHAAVWRVDVGGAGLVQLTRPGARHDFLPSYSPDGTRITFERDAPDFSGSAVWVMNADGTNQHRIGRPLTGSPAWGPGSSPAAASRLTSVGEKS